MWAIWGSAKKVLKYNIYLKNSFAWLTDMTQMIFWYKNFFGSGLFLTFFWIWWIKKVPRAKKVVNEKNWFLHARQLREGIFDVSSNSYCIFTIEVFFSKWPPLFQFWELMSKNEISRTISYIYFMKIMAASWFPETGPSLLLTSSATTVLKTQIQPHLTKILRRRSGH